MTLHYHTLHMGRSSIDLYANNIGVPFSEIESFAAYVGGSPTNISVGISRLGLKTALLTALGKDPVGDFILQFLQKEGIATEYIPIKSPHRTSAVVLGIEPPDKFPLVYYRDNCADIELTIDDVLKAPIKNCQVFQFAGTNLCKDPSRSATLFAAEQAKALGKKVVLDLDFRPDQWHDPRAFGVAIRSTLPLVDMVLGTKDEINAAMLISQEQMTLTHSQVSDAKVEGNIQNAISIFLQLGPEVIIEKRGREGATIHTKDYHKEVAGFPVEVKNILGAGDAFAAGFIYGYLQKWDYYKAARLGNACGAIVVTKHGCANFMPSLTEVEEFVKPHGGL